MSRFILSDAPQGSPEWFLARAGRATGSRAKDIVAKTRGGYEAAGRRNYLTQLVTEILTGAPQEDAFETPDMRWGKEQEPFARMAGEALTGNIVEETGFAYLPDVRAGCSVDGFVQTRRGFVEIKCPKSATHIGYLLAGKLPPAYEPQIMHNFFVTGCEYADFFSFDPRLPEHLQLFHVRVEREEKKVEAYVKELMQFLAEVDELEAQLRKRAA